MPFATTLCVDGVEVWDNTITKGFVDHYQCLDNACNLNLMNCNCVPDLNPTTVDITTALWYCATDPHSSEFLGIYLLKAEGQESRPWDRNIYEPYCNDGQTSGYVGPLRTKFRTMTFTVLGIGLTCGGAAFGRKWLMDGIQGDCKGGTHGACTYDVQMTDCCDVDPTTGIPPRTWQANNAGVLGPVTFENICNCLIWRATFQIIMQPYFFDCQGIAASDIVPAVCGTVPCISASQWAARYTDLCAAECHTDDVPGIAFPDSCEDVFYNQFLVPCTSDPRTTPCLVHQTAPACIANSDACSFTPPKPSSKASSCSTCISSNISDWGSCAAIDTLGEELVFNVTVEAGMWDIFGVHVAIFQTCPINDSQCIDPVWELTIPKMNAESVYSIDGISGTDNYNCSGALSVGSAIGATRAGSSVLVCGIYFASVRYGCMDGLVNSPDFNVNIKPIIRRPSI